MTSYGKVSYIRKKVTLKVNIEENVLAKLNFRFYALINERNSLDRFFLILILFVISSIIQKYIQGKIFIPRS